LHAAADATLDALANETSPGPGWAFDAADLGAVRARLEGRADLAGFRLVRRAPVDLIASYFDTHDYRLARDGVALRLCSDGTHSDAALESLPAAPATLSQRYIITQPLEEARIESLLAAAGPVAERARTVAAGTALQNLFDARTHREVFGVLRGEVHAAEIRLEDTRLSAGEHGPAQALQRVEVKLHDGGAEVLQPLVDALRETTVLEPARLGTFEAGMRAAGLALAAPLAPASISIEPAMSAITVGQQLLRAQLATWRALEPAVRAGRDPEALHQLRVAGRRLIAVLRILEAAPLSGALRLRRRVQALVRRSSAARDLDVQSLELRSVERSTAGQEPLPLLGRLARQRAVKQVALVRLLDTAHTAQLFAALHALAEAPPPRRRVQSAAAAAEASIRRRYRRTRQAARLVAQDASIVHCHRLRLEAKKLRYVAEPFATLYGEPLERFVRRLQQLQSLLGCINDAAHAIHTLESEGRRRRRGVPASVAFAMGRMAEQQQARLLAARKRLPSAWSRIGGKRWRQLRARMDEVRAAQQSTSGT
jgi:CHAD domain-containing protein